MPGEHLIEMAIQALLALAVFSFLEYSIRTLHTPQVVNRRAKLVCAAGLTLGVLGVWILLFHRPFGLALALIGNAIAVAAMIWLETQAPRFPRPDEPADTTSAPTEPGPTETGANEAPASPEAPAPGEDGSTL